MVASISSSGGASQIQQLMQEMRKKMKAADTDGSEGLSKEELSSINTDNDEGGANFISSLQNNFGKIDSNSDGQLSQKEIKAARPKRPMGPPPGMFLDKNSSSDSSTTSTSSTDGTSSTNNTDFHSSLMEQMQKKMKSADTDGTEGLSKDELSSINTDNDVGGANFISSLQNNFDKIDSNSDGQLSQDEIKAARPEKPMGPPPGMFLSSEDDDSDSSSSNSSNTLGNTVSSMVNSILQQYKNTYDTTNLTSSVEFAA